MNTAKQLCMVMQVRKAYHSLALLMCYFSMSVASGEEPVVARYVRINLPGDERVLSLAEVQVYSGEKLISVLGKARQTSTFRSATPEKAIDGNSSGEFFAGSVSSTEPGNFVWWKLDLGSDQEVTKLVINNRTDCCAERLSPAQILLHNSAQKLVWQASIESTQQRYEFDVKPVTASEFPAGRNLLRNATFLQSTSPPLPDYWDLHHAAAVTFKDLHSHYGIDSSVTGPLPGVGVLKIVNSEDDFRYVILMPTRIDADLPGGDYTYTVYVKADRDAVIHVTKAWAVGPEVTKKITTDWLRYTFKFSDREGARNLQPVMYFPKKGTYFVAAPQLEEGAIATPFDALYGGKAHQTTLGRATQKLKAWIRSSIEPEANGVMSTQSNPAIQSTVEYDYYTTQDTARVLLSSGLRTEISAEMSCLNNTDANKTFFEKSLLVPPQSSTYVDVPINNLPLGAYSCRILTNARDASVTASTVEIKKLKSNPVEVRFNSAHRFFTIRDTPFYLIGIAVLPGAIPDWYFSDLKNRGINTIFYNRGPDSNGRYDVANVKAVVTAAAKFDLKVIVGLSMAGAKPADWRRKLSAFIELIQQLKGYPQIIGWYSVDEPSANTWRDDELLEIFHTVKQADPYRLVFVNWAYDGVPKQVGQQPRGTLGATDIYAIDYYPFTAPSHSLNGFTEITTRAALTAGLFNKPFFSWLQLYGGNDAWREPTGAELNYMAFVNFIYGGVIGYFDTKSNSAVTWDRLKTINQQGNELAQTLFLNKNAVQLMPPAATDQFLYTVWKKGASVFLIVLNRDSVSREFLYDASALMRDTPKLSVRSMFEGRGVKMANSQIDEWLEPYESKVYEIAPQ